LSDDRAHGLTIIAFIGSVFSPWYAWARRRGAAPAENHCAMNVALYGAGGKRWAMTERGAADVSRDAHTLRIGPSAMHWDGSSLTIDVDEVTAPLPRRIRGSIRVHPAGVASRIVALDASGRHGWSPIAPRARVDVALQTPGRSWSGDGYFDCNWGARPLEDDFAHWTWCRAPHGQGAAVTYDVARRDGSTLAVALHYDGDGRAVPFEAPPVRALPRSFWGLARGVRSEGDARLLQTLEDAPFYGRCVVETELAGRRVVGVQEGLSLDRFDTHWMRLMLPFKAPRNAGATRKTTAQSAYPA
jgi:carotenoid 1,2-hydratase